MNTITRIFEFDAAHRVMNEKVKCFNLHGHRFKVEVTFTYDKKLALGYAIDFKEIKRVLGSWIDEHLDHACLLNPMDRDLINLCKANNWRLYIMGLGNAGDYNPSAENIASELFTIAKTFFDKEKDGVEVTNIRLYETPNCWVDTTESSVYRPLHGALLSLINYKQEKGTFDYDIRNAKKED